MANQKRIPETIRKKFKKDKPSLFPFPLPLKKKIEVTKCYRCNRNKSTKLCLNCRKPICNPCETEKPKGYCVPCRNEKFIFVTFPLE